MNNYKLLKGMLPLEVSRSVPRSDGVKMPELALRLQDKKFEAIAHPCAYEPSEEYDPKNFEVPAWIKTF